MRCLITGLTTRNFAHTMAAASPLRSTGEIPKPVRCGIISHLATYAFVLLTYGRPQAISGPQDVDEELRIIQKALPKPEFPGLSGTDCLTMNISVPEDVSHSCPLPVLVFIHGGGFTVGSNWWPQYDMSRIVRLSKSIDKPVIGVNIKCVCVKNFA